MAPRSPTVGATKERHPQRAISTRPDGRMDAAEKLEAIAEVTALDIAVRLRGGWAMDFFLGYVTRPHRDVDWFAWSSDAAHGPVPLRTGHRNAAAAPRTLNYGAPVQASETERAIRVAVSITTDFGLLVREVTVLHDSNVLTLRLQPCDVLARVAPAAHQRARLEVDVAQRLAGAGSPVAALESPHVFARGDYVVTLWTYYEPVTTQPITSREYVTALERLHAGMRDIDVPTPHFTDRVSAAQTLVADHARTPGLAALDRVFLAGVLDRMRRAVTGSGRSATADLQG